MVNQLDCAPIMEYQFENLNSIYLSKEVGFSINSSALMDTIDDGSNIYIDGNFIGLIGGKDQLSSFGGVIGCFQYQNDTIYGLSDDTLSVKMQGEDAVADIKDEIIVNTEFSLKVEYQSLQLTNFWPYTNMMFEYFLTYTTPCDTFSTTLTDNVNVCKGAQAQLNATGGASTPLSHPAYEWLPQVGLSCYNCPNPIVTADTINYYTCRIWNNDSCSKMLPVKINILPLPSMPTIEVDPTLCSGNTGHIEITNQPTPYTYTLDGGTPQTTLHFNNLSAGNHTLQIATNNGCSIDTLLTVAEINNVVAQFTASPTNGDVPLTVNFTNQSANATNYSWYIQNDTLNTHKLVIPLILREFLQLRWWRTTIIRIAVIPTKLL
jgi:hypothetical protein